MSPAKVTLSPKEQEMVVDGGWILTKNTIIRKVYELFGGLLQDYQDQLNHSPILQEEENGFRSPKISKGEQYEGLPWVMLDYPRYFTEKDVFAIRSFFWWGNYCSICLQLSGRFHEKYAKAVWALVTSRNSGNTGWYICISRDAWQHHFREDNFIPIENISEEFFFSLPFIKLAKKISLDQWELLPDFFTEQYAVLLAMLKNKGDQALPKR